MGWSPAELAWTCLIVGPGWVEYGESAAATPGRLEISVIYLAAPHILRGALGAGPSTALVYVP